MKVVIAGLGVAGSYLLRRLGMAGFDVTGYDPKPGNYYIPCGYAANFSLLSGMLKNIGIDAEKYVLSRAEKVVICGEQTREITFKSSGLCTVDKNVLERDMIEGTRHENKIAPRDSGDVLIDATGISRYYLGPARQDFTMYTREFITSGTGHRDFYFRYFPDGMGYYWEFPLGSKFHVGAGSSDLTYLDRSLSGITGERKVGRKIRLMPLFGEAISNGVIGVGEAIGTVSPITGEGIVPSMKSAEILFRCLSSASDLESLKSRYPRELRREFSTYSKLYALLTNFRSGKKGLSNVRYARAAIKDLRHLGIDFRMGRVLGTFI